MKEIIKPNARYNYVTRQYTVSTGVSAFKVQKGHRKQRFTKTGPKSLIILNVNTAFSVCLKVFN